MGGDFGAAATAIAAQTAEFIADNLARIAATAAVLALAADLANEAKDDFEEATDSIVDINRRREVLAARIHRHNLKVTLPFQKFAMTTALRMDEMQPDYNGLCSFYQSLSRRQLAGAQVASRNYLSLFCIQESKSRRELDYFSGIASVDSSYSRVKNQERREELMRNIKVDTVQSVHAGTFSGPNGVFGLIDSAAQIYGYIQNQSATQFAGAATLLGSGIASTGTGFDTSAFSG